MTAPRIINIDIPSGEVMYPRRISIIVTFDQQIIYPNKKTDQVIFEAKTAIDFTRGDNANPSNPVGLGQVQVVSQQISPNQTQFSFQISPFANGPLQISNRPWNLPFYFNAQNSWGEPADWSPLFAPGLFESVVQKPYFSWISVRSPHILYDSPGDNYPKLDKAAVCLNPQGVNVNPEVQLRFGPSPDFPETYLSENLWNEGKFWWWYDICCRHNSLDLFSPGFVREYAWSTCGFQITSTSPAGPCPPFPNSGGTNPNTGDPRQYYNYNTCQTQSYCVCPWIRKNPVPLPDPWGGWIWYGRLNNWIIATPNMDFVQSGPDEWYDNIPSAVNDFNLSPWNLASKSRGQGMLFQCYVAQGWRYIQALPPDR